MIERILIILISVVVISGCATPQRRKPTPVNNLQFKIAQMERKLNEREKEAQELRNEIDRLSYELEEATMYADEDATIVEPVVVNYGSTTTTKANSKDGRIIRVSAKPQSVQKALKNAGYYTGSIDGKIGRGSKKAIIEFQTDHNLKADGIVGKKTWSKLQEYLSN